MRLVLISLLLLPLAEIAAFVLIGRMIGVLAVLGLTVASGVVGIMLLRIQGADTLRKLTEESRAGRDAGRALVHAALIVVAAFLLIIPGFITDIVGLLLFIPLVRDFVWSIAKPRVVIVRTPSAEFSDGSHPSTHKEKGAGQVIDLEPEDFERRGGGDQA